MSVIFLFIDGVGLGAEDSDNPFNEAHFRGFTAMAGDQPFSVKAGQISRQKHVFRSVDANLGVEGLPQSGTGQTTLFTGENASKRIGKHFGPFPHSGIKPLLKKESLFHKVRDLGKSCQFINAYPEIFFKKAKERNRWSCTTLMTKSAGVPLNTVTEVKEKRALTAEITQQAWREQLNIEVPEISPEEAGDRLLEQAEHYDLLLHEYYLTDKAGHSQELQRAYGFLKTYDRFLHHLIKNRPEHITLVLCSDHGNIEDLSVKTHTRNRVPLFVLGPGARYFMDSKSILDVTPAIVRTLSNTAG